MFYYFLKLLLLLHLILTETQEQCVYCLGVYTEKGTANQVGPYHNNL